MTALDIEHERLRTDSLLSIQGLQVEFRTENGWTPLFSVASSISGAAEHGPWSANPVRARLSPPCRSSDCYQRTTVE